MTVRSFSELSRELLERYKRVNKVVFYDEKINCIVIDVRFRYEIDMERIDTKAKAVEWVCQLCDKNWVTMEVLQDFLALTYNLNGWEREMI